MHVVVPLPMESVVFIISPPRSGSTLLQRLLASHKEITSLSEISLLLRFLGEPSDVIRYADYRETNIEIAKSDIRDVWPDFDNSYRQQICGLMEHIYERLSEGKKIFIDKTPRYTLIAEEIYKTFPNAKFITLWRHPLAIAASVSKTFARNSWNLGDFQIDLTRGLDRLHAFDSPNRDRVFSLRYEDLVADPATHLKQLGAFLEVTNLEDVLDKPLKKAKNGRLGDPSGTHKYNHISSESSHTWKKTYNTFYRQNWAIKYFRAPRREWLAQRGYELPQTFASEPLLRNIHLSLKECYRVRRKSSKHLRKIYSTFKNNHISSARVH